MIDIKDKKDCVGCLACGQICPVNCISFERDSQGFSYPRVDTTRCIDCHLCEKTCPVICQADQRIPAHTLAVQNKDISRIYSSSSGGAFITLAEDVIDRGGVVFGARFNEQWDVIHDFADTLDGLKLFQGSKYVQSDINESFIKAKEFLEGGRLVLFSGTSCQIAALKLFLRKDYGNQLLTIDIVCHGVPSPRIWHDYISDFSSRRRDCAISKIRFRDKQISWNRFGLTICTRSITTSETHEEFEIAKDNTYMMGFLRNLYLRPSCYFCPAKGGKSGSDITLADYWGIENVHPEIETTKGVSLLLVNTPKGEKAYGAVSHQWNVTESAYESALQYNPAIESSSRIDSGIYKKFWDLYHEKGLSAIDECLKLFKPSPASRALAQIKRPLRWLKQLILK